MFRVVSICCNLLVLIVICFIFVYRAISQSGRQKLNLHEVVVVVDAAADTSVVEEVQVQDPIGTFPAMKIRTATGSFLLLRVHRTRLTESLMKGVLVVVATGDPVALSAVAEEAVSAMEKLEKRWTTILVGRSSVAVELDVGTYGFCFVSLLVEWCSFIC